MPKLLGTRRKFKQYGQSGKYVSELLPHMGGVVDDVAFVSTIHTENFNHAPAKIFVNTGSTRSTRALSGAHPVPEIVPHTEGGGFIIIAGGLSPQAIMSEYVARTRCIMPFVPGRRSILLKKLCARDRLTRPCAAASPIVLR